ncbi:MAG: hypothetical protein KDA61_10690 [Planctomycetales bacterium]|nr:hypothetical protein [Planctomycetales bacterium]
MDCTQERQFSQNGASPREAIRSKSGDVDATLISNFVETEESAGDGKRGKSRTPRSMNEIIQQIRRETCGWPRRVDNVLFVDDDEHGLDWFDRRTTAALFGWLRRRATVRWAQGGNYVGQAELFAELERTAERYEAIELHPHEPLIDGVYYRCKSPPPGDGSALQGLISRFRPETTVDAELIRALILTTFWGGPAGCRPAFVITSDQGRGVGKTKLAELVSHLAGGFIDVSNGEDISTLKQRFLSPEGQAKRVALIDNIKTMRMSWAELEALITAPVISGKRMYVGEGRRPNLITWMITLNGVSLATDMAQRSIIIKLVRGENDGPWYEDAIRYVDEHRQAIVGDVLSALRSDPRPLQRFTRWATWERGVLMRLRDPQEAQKLILDRQAEANCETDEAEIIEESFADKLAHAGYNPTTAQVRIPVAIAAEWYGNAIGEKVKTQAASKRLKQMHDEGQISRISPDSSRTYGRCFIWTGDAADISGARIENDLHRRIEDSRATWR